MADLLALAPRDVKRHLSPEEVVHMATELGAYWAYDYQALERGKPGLHAELKSGRHSDGFFVSRIILQHPNILEIMAYQLALVFWDTDTLAPELVAGIPDGATKLGKKLAGFLDTECSGTGKGQGKRENISHAGNRPQRPDSSLRSFCTRGTGFRETILDIISKQPRANFILYEPVIINRGGLSFVEVEGVGDFIVLPIADHRVNDWDPKDCPLCMKGSEPIKPKATEENWKLITNSQK